MEPREYGFDERLVMSNGHAASVDVNDVLLQCIPGAVSSYKAARCNDRLGVDWWVEMCGGRHLAVDAKVREVDWAASHPNEDDLAIETFSVWEKRKIGWSRDQSKRCDYVLWLWKDTGRYCLVPFPLLCKVCQENWRTWKEQYKTSKQRTPMADGSHYHSECVFVPRREVWGKIYETFGGSLALAKAGA
jgi:hypothetical protein